MERLDFSQIQKSNNGLKTKSFVTISGAIDNVFNLENCDYDILVKDLAKDQKIVINVLENSSAKISFFINNELDNLDIEINCYKNSELNVWFADFSKDKNIVNTSIYLKEEGATAIWKLASLTSKQDNKVFNISAIHEARSTYAKVETYGVCKDSGKLVFDGVSHILNGRINSKTYQTAKIMVFDKASNAVAKPILKIDENDIAANHAAVVGKVNDEHLFYLTSRGLSEAQAKEIITFGYLKPILEGFIDEDVKEEISKLIEGRM